MRTHGEVSSTTSERRAGARRRPKAVSACATLGVAQSNLTAPANKKKPSERAVSFFDLLVALQKTPSLLGAECQGVGTTPLHANERGQTVRFVAFIEPPVYWGISIYVFYMRLVYHLIRG